MIVDKIHKKIFVDVHYEQVYNSMSLNSSQHALRKKENADYDSNGITVDSEVGIYQRTLIRSTVPQMNTQLKQKYINGYAVYFDMEHISKIDASAGKDLKSLFMDLSKNNSVYIYNVSSDIVNKLNSLIGTSNYHNVAEKNYYVISNDSNVSDESLKRIHGLARESFDKRLTEMIAECCEECTDGKSPSSCVKLTKYINTKKLLDDFKDAYYLVYKLALILDKEGVLSISDKNENKDKILFVHTMNSTVIGSILAQLFAIDMLLVDHLGPYNKLFIDGLEGSIDSTKKYVVVTDVVCMGTELSSARTLLDIFGAVYYACVTIVDIIPVGLQEPEELKIHALYVVNKDHNTIGYKITTDLE